jgi:hypothetical protein
MAKANTGPAQRATRLRIHQSFYPQLRVMAVTGRRELWSGQPLLHPFHRRPFSVFSAQGEKANSLAPAKALRDGDGARKPKP